MLTSHDLRDFLPSNQHAQSCETDTFFAYWIGWILHGGASTARDSVFSLSSRLLSDPASCDFSDIRGIFGLWFYDKRKRDWIIFSDNAGLFKIYYTGFRTYISLIDAARSDAPKSAEISHEDVMEYINTGSVFGNKTLFRRISKVRDDEVLIFSGDTTSSRIIRKSFRATHTTPERALALIMDEFSNSTIPGNLSVDLTGGLDSRVIACLLSRRGLEFETAVAGYENNPDVHIARHIASFLRRPFFWFSNPELPVDTCLRAAFEISRSELDIVLFHRAVLHADARRARHIDTIAHGGGGELLRDHAFVHEFPFYNRRVRNYTRMYQMRLRPMRFNKVIMSHDMKKIYESSENYTVDKLKQWTGDTAAQTCDMIYYYGRYQEFFGATYSIYTRMGFNVFSPFLDRKVAESCIMYPPWKRVFALLHRRILSSNCPELARFRTMDGLTGSLETKDILRDLPRHAGVQIRRLARKVSEKYVGKSAFYKVGAPAAEMPGYRTRVRKSECMKVALDVLKNENILAKDAAERDISDTHLGRIITLGLLIDAVRR